MNHHHHRVVLATLAVLGTMTSLPLAHASQSRNATAEVQIDRSAYIDDAGAFQALQEAVDAGGAVVVTGVFVLAPGQSLIIGRHGQDVTIAAGPSGGTLVGGTNTIRQTGAVEMTIAGLTIEGSRDAYVLVEATSGTTVRRCQMTGLASSGVGAVGVRVQDLRGSDPVDLIVMDNAIDAGNTTWAFTAAVNVGILVTGAAIDLEALIAGNAITAAQTAGIFVFNSNGSYTIQDNTITLDGDTAKGPFLWAAGVWGHNLARSVRSFVVTHNVINVTGSVFAVGYGNFVPGAADPPNVVVHHNEVHVTNGVFSAFLLHGNVDASVWKDNVVEGEAVNVFAILPAGKGPAEDNLFDKNDIRITLLAGGTHPFFKNDPAVQSHLYFAVGADKNVAKGFATLDVVDKGQDNIIR